MHRLKKFARSLLRPYVRTVGRRYTNDWVEAESGLRRRPYESYDAYRLHQAAKLDLAHSLAEKYDEEIETALGQRHPEDVPVGCRVLCLGARLGGEVRAFRNLGAFAWGIDLNPGKDNSYVAFGDFHNILLPDGSVDVVYCNVMDHVYDPSVFFKEIRRVLCRGGRLQLEVMNYAKEMPGRFESLTWRSTDDLVKLLSDAGMYLNTTTTFKIPWEGTQLNAFAK